MKRTLPVLLLLSLACSGLRGAGTGAPESPGEPGLCEGREVTTVWQGEYPSPVIDVTRPAPAPARKEPCGPIVGSCTLQPGLYHPWADRALAFATVRPALRYRLNQAHTSGDAEIDTGETVEVTAYMGEGFCAYRHDGRALGDHCPEILNEQGDAELLTLLNPEDEDLSEHQLFQASCAEGARWITVEDALQVAGIREGLILGYGEIGAAD